MIVAGAASEQLSHHCSKTERASASVKAAETAGQMQRPARHTDDDAVTSRQRRSSSSSSDGSDWHSQRARSIKWRIISKRFLMQRHGGRPGLRQVRSNQRRLGVRDSRWLAGPGLTICHKKAKEHQRQRRCRCWDDTCRQENNDYDRTSDTQAPDVLLHVTYTLTTARNIDKKQPSAACSDLDPLLARMCLWVNVLYYRFVCCLFINIS